MTRAIAALLLLTACEEKDATTPDTATENEFKLTVTGDPPPHPTDDTDTVVITDEVTDPTLTLSGLSYNFDARPIFEQYCTECHGNGNDSGGFNFDAGPAGMVGIESIDVSNLLLVSSGSRQDSYVWHKMNNTHNTVGGAGGVMPPGNRAQPTANELNTIGQWIDDGALP